MNFTEIMMFQDSIDDNYFEYLQKFNEDIQNNISIPQNIKNEIFELLQEIVDCNNPNVKDNLIKQINNLLKK